VALSAEALDTRWRDNHMLGIRSESGSARSPEWAHMEIREFAERVLFATTLEEKLADPGDCTDERPGTAMDVPSAPGRPVELVFRPGHVIRAEPPSLTQLEQERERGRLLHFFANHELLATELMALALLRFPDAPSAFRRGVLRTLRDEQEHTRLYLRRMAECGIALGELPVSGWFWRCVAPMESPLDYVASLCLTFEQANLDFARHFGRAFAQVGDASSAALLERIYHDEIGHVAYGLKWFRQWKHPQESDWLAFCRALKFPLTPRRAKGFSLNVEGRLAAGFDAEFVAQLDVFAQSKGRTPVVHWFNPLAEARIAYGRAFNPVQHQAQLVRDLETLPMFLARQDDVVLVRGRPSVPFLSRLKQAGFVLPEFGVVTGERARVREAGLEGRKLGGLRPWAWGPDALEFCAELLPMVSGERRPAGQRFHEGLAQLYSKEWSAQLLRRLMDEREPWWGPVDIVGHGAGSIAELLEHVRRLRSIGYERVVVKESLGVAGHNSLRLWEADISTAQLRWLERAVAEGRRVVVEPWLERLVDFSVQFERSEAGLKLCGYTGLVNDLKGQFQANWAAADYARRLPAPVVSWFAQVRDADGCLRRGYARIAERLEQELRPLGFIGALGVDAFVYRDATGQARLKPVVEINPRATMGRVTLELMKNVTPGCSGLFRLLSRGRLAKEGFADFTAYSVAESTRFPLLLEGQPRPKISRGSVVLNDAGRAQAVLALFRVERNLKDLL